MDRKDTIKTAEPKHHEFINKRNAEIKSILLKVFESVTKFLFVANSGGILAVAGVIKIDDGYVLSTKIAISCFVLGLIMASLLLLWLLYRTYSLDRQWTKNTDLWYENSIDWGELNERDDRLTATDTLEFLLVILSFCGFLFGALSGVVSIWLIGN